jgi:DNA-binding response OmpR family regulator/two-component sensor histidine kinase
LLKLINDILDLSKIEAGRLELSLEEVSLENSFAEILEALRPLSDKKSLQLIQRGAATLSVRADAMRFKQILTNLLGNAIKFTPPGGRVELAAHSVDSVVRVEVRDSGPGIPIEEQKRIFESFYRLRQSGLAPEGTGLGLTITQRLVELHGGELGLESEPGRGSCFYFSLPALAGFEKAPKPQEKALQHAGGGSKILVIEDDPTAAHLIAVQLSTSGYEPVICDLPQRAVEIAAELQPDAITLDILMKPVTGWELLLQLKADSRTREIPVIVLSIVDQPGVGITLGADEYLIKPVKKEELLAALTRCLSSRGRAPGLRPILVVEDDAATRDIIAELLRSQGFSVLAAEDGAQARSLVEASLPELVVLDLLLPKVSGFDLLAEWRASPRTAEVPVFVLTGKDLTPAEQTALRTHAELLLRKQQPWQEELIQQLRRVLPHALQEGS